MAGKAADIIRNCKKATLLSLKKEEQPLSFREQARLSIHLLFCNACKQFVRQSALINKAMKGFVKQQDSDPSYQLSAASREKLQQQIDRLR